MAQSSCYLNASPRQSITPSCVILGLSIPETVAAAKNARIEAGAITLIGQSELLP